MHFSPDLRSKQSHNASRFVIHTSTSTWSLDSIFEWTRLRSLILAIVTMSKAQKFMGHNNLFSRWKPNVSELKRGGKKKIKTEIIDRLYSWNTERSMNYEEIKAAQADQSPYSCHCGRRIKRDETLQSIFRLSTEAESSVFFARDSGQSFIISDDRGLFTLKLTTWEGFGVLLTNVSNFSIYIPSCIENVDRHCLQELITNLDSFTHLKDLGSSATVVTDMKA